MALPLVSARYPQPSSTVNTIGFGFLFIARQNTRIRDALVVKAFRYQELAANYWKRNQNALKLAGLCGDTFGFHSLCVPDFSFAAHGNCVEQEGQAAD